MAGFFETKIEFLKGVGPQRAGLLNKELNIHTFGDLIQYFPFRYEDRTQIHKISELNASMPYVQIKGFIRDYELSGKPYKQRLTAHFYDDTGEIDLIWFQGAKWIIKKLKQGVEYLVFGKPNIFNSRLYIGHPELDINAEIKTDTLFLQPVYPSTEKLKSKYIDSKVIAKLQKELISKAQSHIKESLPENVIRDFKLMKRDIAYKNIHFPVDNSYLTAARFRLKYEEFFYIQLRLLKLKLSRYNRFRGQVFAKTSLLNEFYHKHLPFELTKAQKNVIREIFSDMKSGHQMNRLLQGDVGSGKTIVAFISMLLAIENNAQTVMMAPTEILTEQHYNGLKKYADKLNLRIAILTGSTKKSIRKEILDDLESGKIDIIVGTHALIEDNVRFKNLGFAIVDEQHRFGVAQRAKLWKKNMDTLPHVLVMTATPIPRTLAMTLYGDLEVSVIDELPAGRKPIKTVLQFDENRLKVFGFIRKQIQSGGQIYIVYPLIEESEKLDLKHLMDGYESLSRAFPEYQLSIVHGKMKSADKDFEMKRFINKETQIMVSTTVIEVGVDVPNASVMVIENAERFGLAQLHQLRGRVGRGAEQSYCILMCSQKLSSDARTRLETMVRTNNGFEIANTDLSLRGPGDLMGTQQSGVLDLLIADIAKDGKILQIARESAKSVLEDDPELIKDQNSNIKNHIATLRRDAVNWSRIS
ncbi:MAG: ATP-dependent DNA helicase RecG [Cyclobacteriaceae bacterium]|jgi:ATP-dependent DNA helicase RecG